MAICNAKTLSLRDDGCQGALKTSFRIGLHFLDFQLWTYYSGQHGNLEKLKQNSGIIPNYSCFLDDKIKA